MSAVRTRHLRVEDLRGLRARGYIRESTQAQADRGTPVDRQRADIQRSIESLGMTTDAHWYERTGSGEAQDAPELAAALADGRDKQYDVLVCFALSRFARDRAEAVIQKRAFTAAGVIIYFVAERLISGTYTSALAEGVGEVLDERANAERRMWIAGGQRQRQMSGRWLGVVPFGFRKVMVDKPDGSRGWDGALEPDPDTALVVRGIYDAAARGEGGRAIATSLNAAGHRTGSGGPWRPGSVDAVLTNPVYAGRLVRYRARLAGHYYDHEAEDGHADLGSPYLPIVDPVLFDQVRAVRAARNPAPGTHRMRTYPLSRVLRCARCGRRMTGVRGAQARYYRCSGRAVYKSCDAPGIRADLAEERFAAWLGSYTLPADWRSAIARTRVQAIGAGERDRKAALEGRLRKLRELYEWDHIKKPEYLKEVAGIKASMGVIAMPSMPSIERVAAALEKVGSAWLTAPEELQAAIPPLMLKAAEVNDGQIEFVVDAGLRPLLELCVRNQQRLYAHEPKYTVRFSA